MRLSYTSLNKSPSTLAFLRSSVAFIPSFSPSTLFALSEPGLWIDPSDVANLDWRRNLLTRSNEFSTSPWTIANSGTVASQGVSPPFGTSNAWTLTEAANSQFHGVFQPITLTAATHVFSCYMKAGERTWGRLSYDGGGGKIAWFNLSNGTVGTVNAGLSASISDAGSGWYRCSIAFTGVASSAAVAVGPATGDNGPEAYAGNGTNRIYVFGSQLELGSVATDYQRISDVNTEVVERFPSATLYQDPAGTTPVTTPGQTVALALDKSKGLVLGSELVTNGTFDGSASRWTLANGATYNNNAVNLNVANGVFVTLTQNIAAPVIGRSYRITYTISNYSTGILRMQYGGASNVFAGGNGIFSAIVVATNTSGTITFNNGGNPYVGSIDNISVRELPGFHATQATLASRPTYGIVPLGGRRNLLTRTKEFGDAVWAKANTTVTADVTTAPNETTTADALFETATTGFHSISSTSTIATAVNGAAYTFSVYIKANGRTKGFLSAVTGGGFSTFDLTAKTNVFGGNGTNETVTAQTITELASGWFRLSITSSFSGAANVRPVVGINNDAGASSYLGDITKGLFLWGAQLETGSSATAYQRVGSAFDVTEAGVASLSYLSFDGVDDFMVTPTITPGIDKAQVFAGVWKLSDAGTGVITELGTNAGAGSGELGLYSAFPANGYTFRSRGTSTVDAASPTTFPSPITNVLTGLGDIAGDRSTLRINGTQAAQNTSDQGSDNYNALALYIGRRGGTTLPFNGQIYSLIVRFGTTLDAGTITSTETWVSGKTGITI